MSANFRGIKQLGDSPSDGAVATWTFHSLAGAGNPGAPDAGPVTPTLPDQFGYNANYNSSYKWVLDIRSVQGTYDFGVIKKLRVQINKRRSWLGADGKYAITGRIWVYIPLTNEMFCFDAEPSAFTAVTAVQDSPVSINDSFEVNVPPGATIEVWCESDIGSGGFISSPTMCVVVNAYNRS